MPQDPNDRTQIERIDPLLGSILDKRFRIDFRLAAGGFGAIYRATHVKSKHEFALKVLHPQLTSDAGVVARFQREGAALTSLRCPNTITAYELGEADDGTLYIVMELLRGESLFERFRAHGRFEWKRMIAIGRAVCRSLEEAHALGIIHRDLKPTNIHLERVGDNDDFVKVLDFGIAKILRDSDFDSSDLTNAGQMIGTLDYMSPEQMVGGVCTGKSDIYTLGILMYEMIAGKRPFAEANTAAAALAAILRGSPTPLSQIVPVPDMVNRVVMKCLEREPQDRFDDVIELGAAFDLCLQDEAAEITRTVALELPFDTKRPTNMIDVDPQNDMTMVGTPPPVKVATSRGSQPAIPGTHGRERRDSYQAVPGPLEPGGSRPVLRSASPHLIARDRTPAPQRDDLDSLTDPVQSIPTKPSVPTMAASPRAREQAAPNPNTPAPRAHRDSYQALPGTTPSPQTHGAQGRAPRDRTPAPQVGPGTDDRGAQPFDVSAFQAPRLPPKPTPAPPVGNAPPGGFGRTPAPSFGHAPPGQRHPPTPAPPIGNAPPGAFGGTPAPSFGHAPPGQRHPPTPAPPMGSAPHGQRPHTPAPSFGDAPGAHPGTPAPTFGNAPGAYPATPAPSFGHAPGAHPGTPAPSFSNAPQGQRHPPTPAPPMGNPSASPYGGNFPPTPAPPGAGSFSTGGPIPPTPSPYGGNFPPTPAPPHGQFAPTLPGRPAAISPPYDMANVAARDAAMRRFVWIAVLVLGAIVGIVIATQL